MEYSAACGWLATFTNTNPSLLVSSRESSSSGLHFRFQPKLAFAEVGPKATETAARLGVTSHPTLVVVDADGQQHTYTGEVPWLAGTGTPCCLLGLL